jgi:glycosyltransferase involved in cell wall biosynthesis
MHDAIDCIIPFYNEQERIGKVIEAISHVLGVGRIICVDDGSTDGGAALVREHFPMVKVVRLEENKGKADAVKAGLSCVQTEYVLLMDADLEGLVPEELSEAGKAMQAHPQLDMT